MKRHGNLWDTLISFPNLLRAAKNSARGKRFLPPVLKFHSELEHELFKLGHELREKTYRPGGYRTFQIHTPKKRLISAAPYRDRVVHHALVNVLEPIYEHCFIHDSYACRKGKGTHAAMRRVQHFAQRHTWAWKADIAKFFPSIDHAILKTLLARKIKDPDVLWLAHLLIDHSNPQEEVYNLFPGDDLFTLVERRHGLPLGNQTSQFFANVYLDPLDHFLKDQGTLHAPTQATAGSGQRVAGIVALPVSPRPRPAVSAHQQLRPRFGDSAHHRLHGRRMDSG